MNNIKTLLSESAWSIGGVGIHTHIHTYNSKSICISVTRYLFDFYLKGVEVDDIFKFYFTKSLLLCITWFLVT